MRFLSEYCSYTLGKKHGLAVVEKADRVYLLAQELSGFVLDFLSTLQVRVKQEIKLEIVSAAWLEEQWEKWGKQGAQTVLEESLEDSEDLSLLVQNIPKVEDVLEQTNAAPMIRLLNAMLMQALQEGASDIHIEPYESESLVRLRIDGQLRVATRVPIHLHSALISRLKIMAALDIAECRLPQDGRISLRIGKRGVDVRVSTLPSTFGERAVLRILDKSKVKLDLGSVGLREPLYSRFKKDLASAHGLVLVTGPTGSGKTTTLYSALKSLDHQKLNIMTVEDPVEYELPGIAQTQVNGKIDLSFAKALRAMLRQDPDVMMIGEIRDAQSAQIAIQAALTGHLVLATLHTNDAPSAVARLVDMGVEPFLLSSCLLGSLGQRLVRLTCQHCHGGGCAHCAKSGYHGRVGIFEYLQASAPIRQLIHNQASEEALLAVAKADGYTSMYEYGMQLVSLGVTTQEEVLRVCRQEV